MKKREFLEGGIQKIEGIMVSKNAACWEKFRFISGAKSKDQTRFHMSGIHIEHAGDKTVLVSSDGRRMHIATMETLDIEPGDYEVKENTRDFMILYPMDEIQYPNWKKIVKQQKSKKHTQIEINGKKGGAFSASLFKLYKATDKIFNSDFIEALAAVASARYNSTWDIYFSDTIEEDVKKGNMSSNEQTVFINNDLMAIIMPMSYEGVKVEEITAGPDFKDITPEPKVLEFKPKEEKGKEKSKARRSA